MEVRIVHSGLLVVYRVGQQCLTLLLPEQGRQGAAQARHVVPTTSPFEVSTQTVIFRETMAHSMEIMTECVISIIPLLFML